jgi:hypothetical protein
MWGSGIRTHCFWLGELRHFIPSDFWSVEFRALPQIEVGFMTRHKIMLSISFDGCIKFRNCWNFSKG